MTMTLTTILPGWQVPSRTAETRIRRYSTTGDILSYKRCRRQYGVFGVRGFSSATNTQRYFGTLVHDVLDQINRDYRRDPTMTLPDEPQIEALVDQAHDRLIRSGVRPFNADIQQAKAVTLIYRFVMLIGPHFFPHVTQTEYRLERALKTHLGRDYVLDGVVDVLSGAVSHSLGLFDDTTADDVEIWDYKSGRAPDHKTAQGRRELDGYVYQMQVYAELYRLQTGDYPARSVLVFVGELGDDRVWQRSGLAPTAFPRLIHRIQPSPSEIAAAMRDFHETVEAIEAEREKSYADQWHAPDHKVDEQTCEACDLRFNCSSYPGGARLRQQPL